MKVKNVIKLLIISFISIQCRNKLEINTVAVFDFNSTDTSYTIDIIKIDDLFFLKKYTGKVINNKIKNITNALYEINVNNKSIFVQEEKIDSLEKILNIFLKMPEKKLKYNITSEWLKWENMERVGLSKLISYDPELSDSDFNSDSNMFMNKAYLNAFNNKNHTYNSFNDVVDSHLKSGKQTLIDNDIWRKNREILLESQIMSNLNKSDRNRLFKFYKHNPAWILKVLGSGINKNEISYEKIILVRADDEKITINGVSIKNNNMKLLIESIKKLKSINSCKAKNI